MGDSAHGFLFGSFTSWRTTERRRVTTHELLSPSLPGSLLTSYWPSRSDKSSNQQQQPGPRRAYRKKQPWQQTACCWTRGCQDWTRRLQRWERNPPVVQRNEVEVGDLDRRPQLEDRVETRDASPDMMDEAWNEIQRTHVVVWDESVAVVLQHQERKGNSRTWTTVLFFSRCSSKLPLLTLHFLTSQTVSPIRKQLPPHPPTLPLSEWWWWAQTPVGEKSVQKVSRMLFFMVLN